MTIVMTSPKTTTGAMEPNEAQQQDQSGKKAGPLEPDGVETTAGVNKSRNEPTNKPNETNQTKPNQQRTKQAHNDDSKPQGCCGGKKVARATKAVGPTLVAPAVGRHIPDRPWGVW